MREDNMHGIASFCFFHQFLFLLKLDIILSSGFLKKEWILMCNFLLFLLQGCPTWESLHQKENSLYSGCHRFS
jgi:hypothetical protein